MLSSMPCRRWAALSLLGLTLPAFAATDVGVRVTVAGETLPGATVTLLDDAGTDVVAEGRDDDGDGVVRFADVDAGRYRAAVAAPGAAVRTASVTVPADGEITVTVAVTPGLSNDYLELGYVVDADVAQGAFGGSGERDAEGYTLRGSIGFGRYVFLRGDGLLLHAELPMGEVAGDWLSAGPGARLPLSLAGRPLSVWGQLSYDRLTLGSLGVFTGWGMAGGLRLGLAERLEIETWYKRAETEDDAGAVDVTPETYGIGVLYRVSPAVGLTASFVDGEVEVENGGTARSDLDLFTVGLRFDYGGGRPASLPPADAPGGAVSYDYLQLAYPLSGDLEPEGAAEMDVDGGLTLAGYRQVTDHVFLSGGARTLDYESATGNDQALTDMYYAGPGVRHGGRLGPVWVDVYGMVSYDRVASGGDNLDGLGGKVGVRLRPHRRLELDAWYKYSDVSRRDRDIESDLYGASLIAYLAPAVGLEVGYLRSDLEDRSGGVTDEADLDVTYLGLRLHY